MTKAPGAKLSRFYHIEQGSAAGAPFVYIAVFPDQEEAMRQAAQLVDAPFTLVAFEVEGWNNLLTPWPAPAIRKGADFGGHGGDTLQQLLEKIIPAAEGERTVNQRFICGYSLSGLFALWSLTQTDAFAGAASISGSLWYRDFPRLLKKSLKAGAFPADAQVYLSLGNAEARTKNAVMATVEKATNEVAEMLSSNPLVSRCTLEMNKGGHFDNATQRIAAGISWLLEGTHE
ncbi:MAG: alpha/beta hydrolase [Lachnospiraceae bacterium]|nr:alpha/beta hydrolase [Lachnospiraceae bacterium]